MARRRPTTAPAPDRATRLRDPELEPSPWQREPFRSEMFARIRQFNVRHWHSFWGAGLSEADRRELIRLAWLEVGQQVPGDATERLGPPASWPQLPDPGEDES